jgi:hypothetical protein
MYHKKPQNRISASPIVSETTPYCKCSQTNKFDFVKIKLPLTHGSNKNKIEMTAGSVYNNGEDRWDASTLAGVAGPRERS